MKIGIITWFDNLNYGTALQAVALQRYLKEELGADVRLIKYHPSADNQIKSIKQKTQHLPYKLVKKVAGKFYDSYKEYDRLMANEYKEEANEKKARFDSFMSEIEFTSTIESYDDLIALNDEFDMFICGSDQIWNPQILDKCYFLSFATKPKISYACSFGVNEIPDYAREHIKEYLSGFKAISLRENACKNRLEDIIKKEVEVVCDPTLLFDKSTWNNYADEKNIPKEDYFVVYFLGDTKFGREAIDYAEKRLGIKCVALPSTPYTIKRADRASTMLGPSDFIGLIKNAKFVLTDSFHATLFSIIFNKDFAVIEKHSRLNPFNQNSRITGILEKAGISNRFVHSTNELGVCIDNDIEYDAVNEKINEFSNSSKEFLKKSISE